MYQKLDFVLDGLNSDFWLVSEMDALVLEYLHIFQLVVLLELIQLVIILLQKIKKLPIVVFGLLHVNISARKCIFKLHTKKVHK